MGPAPTWQILGTKETSPEADAAVRACLKRIRLHDPMLTGAALRGIVRELAQNHAEINDRTYVEFVSPTATMTADMIQTGTLDASAVDVVNIDASNISTGTLSASKVLFPDGSALTTASRVLTSSASVGGFSSPGDDGAYPVTGLGWTVTTASPADVYNIFAQIVHYYSGLTIEVVIDGNVAGALHPYTDAASQGAFPYFLSITGLSAGTHTLQLYVVNAQGVQFNTSTYAVCQRIF